MKRNKVALIWTFPIFYGTFKCHESHTEKHLIEYYKPGMAKYSLCNHFYNHKYHHESIACLGVEIRLQIKKLWCKRCFCTVCQESFFCVWHEKQMIILFKTGFLQCCKVVLSNLSLLWDTQKKLSQQHQMFASRQTATIPFECHTQICVWHLWTCSEYPLGKANGQRYALNVTLFVFWSHLPERWSTRAFLN